MCCIIEMGRIGKFRIREGAMVTKNVLDKAVAYKLPNGQEILLKPLVMEDYESLNKWVRDQYMENVTKACAGLNPIEKREFLLAALSHASTMTFQFGDGYDILMGSVFGLSRLVYQLIDRPSMSFENFNKSLFPNGFIDFAGVTVVNEMLDAAYIHVAKELEQEAEQAEILEKQKQKKKGLTKRKASAKKVAKRVSKKAVKK